MGDGWGLEVLYELRREKSYSFLHIHNTIHTHSNLRTLHPKAITLLK